MNINLPDNDFYIIQKKLYKWLQIKKLAHWSKIHQTCIQLLSEYDDSYIDLYGQYPEYKIFMPLLRHGLCEVAMLNGEMNFVPLKSNSIKQSEYFDPYLLLNNIPTLEKQIFTFEPDNAIDLKYKCNLFNKYQIERIEQFQQEIGIYKTCEEVYFPSYIFDGKIIRRIPSYSKNIDAINIARCFVRSKIDHYCFFEYNSKTKELFCSNYSELPILITRALILFDKTQLSDSIYLYPLHKKQPYKNVPINAVNELKRIFGQSAVGEHYD